jgi:N-formylglutamate amidohydrolase
MLRALVTRAYIDLNREPYELDARMFAGPLPRYVNGTTPRVLSGLGTIPRIVADGEDIYRSKLDVAEALERIETIYRPFHRTLAALLNEARQATGTVTLIDCHSMPSSAVSNSPAGHGAQVDVILGDRFGSSCKNELVSKLENLLTEAGLRTRRNRPYAGGFITETYGVPAAGQHAIQIEINRGLYMNERTLQKSSNFAALQRTIRAVLQEAFTGFAATSSTQLAAE